MRKHDQDLQNRVIEPFMDQIETNAYIEMLECQRNQALKGEAVSFAKYKAAEAKIQDLEARLQTIHDKLSTVLSDEKGNDDGRTDTDPT